jgi:hypothetical protein
MYISTPTWFESTATFLLFFHAHAMSAEKVNEKTDVESSSQTSTEIDLYSYHEVNAGRLIVDPEYVLAPLLCSECFTNEYFGFQRGEDRTGGDSRRQAEVDIRRHQGPLASANRLRLRPSELV